MVLEEVSGIEDLFEKGEVVVEIVCSVVMIGDFDGVMEFFDEVFDLIVRVEIDYRMKVDELIKIGEIIEKMGDDFFLRIVREFYRIVFDIFDKFCVN